MLNVIIDKLWNPSNILIKGKGMFTHMLVKYKLAKLGRFLTMQAFRDSVSFYPVASKVTVEREGRPWRQNCGDSSTLIRKWHTSLLLLLHWPELNTVLLICLFYWDAGKSPWQAATSQHQLHIMEEGHKSPSQPLLPAHKVAMKIKWENTHQMLSTEPGT